MLLGLFAIAAVVVAAGAMYVRGRLDPSGEPVGRFRPLVDPADPALRAAVEQRLPG